MKNLWLRGTLTLAVASVALMVAATGAFASAASTTVVRTSLGSGVGFHAGGAYCPSGMYATGGGVGVSGGSNADSNQFVSDSGPVDSSGLFHHTVTGRVPVEWYGTTYIQTSGSSAYVWVVCSAKPTVVVRTTIGTTTGVHGAFATCASGDVATGGGLGVDGGSNADQYQYLTDDGPVNSSGFFVDTTTGTVPTQWYGTGEIETSGTTAYVWAVCSRKVAVTVVRKNVGTTEGYHSAFARCPSGQDATGGGLGIDGGSTSDNYQAISDSGPVNSSLSFDRTATGAVPIQWDGESLIQTPGTTSYVWAVCG